MSRRLLCLAFVALAVMLLLPAMAHGVEPLPLPTTIRGTVYKADGVTPAAGVDIGCFLASDKSWAAHAISGADGKYTLEGLAWNTYYKVNMVTTNYNAANGTSYPDEFYDNITSYDWDFATPVKPGNYSVNFRLGTAAPIIPNMLPVFRFYNSRTAVHFYTASEAEKNDVLAKYPQFSLEGISYYRNANNPYNGTPLYRFYNKLRGTHFYTASVQEKNDVLAKYSSTFSLDGVAYNVSSVPVYGALPVYRFYNKKIPGVHFFTASEAEKNDVLNKYGATYVLEGVGFYVGQ